MKKKKGFTLVELLAVIAILGIVMLIAMVAVLPMINKSEEKTLFNEGKEMVRAAEIAYNENSNMRGKNVCISMEWLNKNGYYEKNYSDDKYVGSVLIINDNDDIKMSFVIVNSKGSIGYENATGEPKNMQNYKSENYTYTSKSISDNIAASSNNIENTYTSTCNVYSAMYRAGYNLNN